MSRAWSKRRERWKEGKERGSQTGVREREKREKEFSLAPVSEGDVQKHFDSILTLSSSFFFFG